MSTPPASTPSACTTHASTPNAGTPNTGTPNAGKAHAPTPYDFDFLHGEWNVVNRRRTDFLDPGSEWEEFGATSRCWSLFDGAADIDELDVPGQGWKGLTLRLFDPAARQWSLNWSSSRSGRLFPPVLGRFGPEGRGVFHGDDTHDGKDVRVRFVWSGISDTTARWEQAFSVDGERTWLTNWVMEFTRRQPS